MAKYSVPMLTDLTEYRIPKKKNANPLTVLRVFLDASRHFACVHPCGLFLEKANIDETTSTTCTAVVYVYMYM
jgi:hypothetical protein